MKKTSLLIIILAITSCIEPSTVSVHRITNPLNYNIEIKTYLNGVLSESILVPKKEFFENVFNQEAPIEPNYDIYDSIIYVFDNMKSIKYIKNTVNTNNRGMGDNSNWQIESIEVNKRKKSSKKIYEYKFIEQDYLDAR